MIERLQDAGAYMILNKIKDRYYYIATDAINTSIKENTRLLEAGLHSNGAMQMDFTSQEGVGFGIMILMQDIEVEYAQEIIKNLLNADSMAYNHREENNES